MKCGTITFEPEAGQGITLIVKLPVVVPRKK
jgi:hypothetical protein